MPASKNALLRYMLLDELLSDTCHDYNLNDLTSIVSDRLTRFDDSSDGISRRMIEKDIKYLGTESPFGAEIERYKAYDHDVETQDLVVKHCLRYKEPGFSIFKKEMSDDEKYLLREALTLLGQFNGLPDFSGLENLQKGLNINKATAEIISFTKNPLADSPLVGEIFSAISHRQVIELHYHTFKEPDVKKCILFHPYLLKEYNRRWYVFGAAFTDNKILNFGLERIDKVVPLPAEKYIPFNGDFSEWFEDIIGVTLATESPLYKIFFWVSCHSEDFVKTKPLHESQRNVRGAKETEFRTLYPMLEGGSFFRIDCRENYELIRELSSFGPDLVVLSPSEISDKVRKRAEEMVQIYSSMPQK